MAGAELTLRAATVGNWTIEHFGFRPEITTASTLSATQNYQMVVTIVRSREIKGPTSFKGNVKSVKRVQNLQDLYWDGGTSSSVFGNPFKDSDGVVQEWILLAHFVDHVGPAGSGMYREVQEWQTKDSTGPHSLIWSHI